MFDAELHVADHGGRSLEGVGLAVDDQLVAGVEVRRRREDVGRDLLRGDRPGDLDRRLALVERTRSRVGSGFADMA